MFCYGTLLSEATIANSHKAYFIKLFKNDVLINLHTQDINRVLENTFCKVLMKWDNWKKLKLSIFTNLQVLRYTRQSVS